jgi:Fe-S-cluster containining protein
MTVALELAPAASTSRRDPCATCGVCCRAYYVPISGFDLWRISRTRGIEPADFVVAYPQRAGGEFGFQLSDGGELYELALEKQGAFQIGQPCVFLESLDDGCASRCGIYADRPAVCRAYPMVATDDNEVITLRPRALCPPGAWPDQEPQQPRWRANWSSLRVQFDQYRQILEAWNAQVALQPGRTFSIDHYLAYLLGVYDKLLAARR